MFCGFRYNIECEPFKELSHLYTQEDAIKYPKRTVLDLMKTELAATNML
jgi:hypothetical protein